ncbi:TPA: hypothetical protein ACH3X1_008789 [Trebouxia sp. C0004]
MTSLLQSQRAVNLKKIPDQSGKVFVVTGGNVGLGYEVAKALAASNAHVFMTARNPEKQRRAIQRIISDHPGAKIEGLHVDYLNGFGNIEDCAEQFKDRNLPLHGLINNIGTENPADIKSKEGFDPTQASNYLGHFYLTHMLLENLMETPQSRVVNLTSLVEPNGTIEWTDIGYACDCILIHACNLQILPLAYRNLLAQKRDIAMCNMCMLYISWHHEILSQCFCL